MKILQLTLLVILAISVTNTQGIFSQSNENGTEIIEIMVENLTNTSSAIMNEFDQMGQNIFEQIDKLAKVENIQDNSTINSGDFNHFPFFGHHGRGRFGFKRFDRDGHHGEHHGPHRPFDQGEDEERFEQNDDDEDDKGFFGRHRHEQREHRWDDQDKHHRHHRLMIAGLVLLKIAFFLCALYGCVKACRNCKKRKQQRLTQEREFQMMQQSSLNTTQPQQPVQQQVSQQEQQPVVYGIPINPQTMQGYHYPQQPAQNQVVPQQFQVQQPHFVQQQQQQPQQYFATFPPQNFATNVSANPPNQGYTYPRLEQKPYM